MTQDTLQITKALSEIGEDIGLKEGIQIVNAFRQAYPEAVPGYFIGRNITDQILNQPGCVGIRYRKCLSEGKEHLVYTGVNDEAKDILTYSAVAPNGELVREKGIVADRLVWDWEVINKPKNPPRTATPGTQRIKTNLSEIGEDIGLEEGTQIVNAFRQAHPEEVPGYFIGRNILDQILNQPGCVGIRYRKCLSEGKEHLVYTGVNDEGKDILTYTVVAPDGELVTERGIVADRLVWDWEVINKPKNPPRTAK